MTETSRTARADKGHVRLQERDRAGMRLIGEQYGVRRDQMARFLGRRSHRATKQPGAVGSTTAQGIIERWCAIGWVDTVSIYTHQPDWLYLTEEGLRALGLPYKPWTPPKSGYLLEHKYWITEVRLLLEEVYPEGRWVSERRLWHERTLTHPPDAEFYLPQATTPIAIEVECSLKDSARLEEILPWLAAHYENTWYFAVKHEVLVRVRAKRVALALAQQERLFISYYVEHQQRWQTSLGQAPPRKVPMQPDQRSSGHEPPREAPPAVSEVLQAIADEWVPPPGHQFGSKRLPCLSSAWMPETFEAAVAVGIRLLTQADQAVLSEMREVHQGEPLLAWSQRLREQLGLEVWGRWQEPWIWYARDANRALWLACGQRDPEEIVFQLMEAIWQQFQHPPPSSRSRQLIRTQPVPPLPRAEWPSTPLEAQRQARALLSPFEALWLAARDGQSERGDGRYPDEVWVENILDQFGLRPPMRKGAQAWNEALWRAAGTAGVAPEKQHLKVDRMLSHIIHAVQSQVAQEAKEAEATAQPGEFPSGERTFRAVKGNASSGGPQASSRRHQASLVTRLRVGLEMLGGVSMLAGVGMLVLGSRSLHGLALAAALLVLGFCVFALGRSLARQDHRGRVLR